MSFHTDFPFGKHRGERLDEIPLSYLQWVLLNVLDIEDRYPGLQDDISANMKQRRTRGQTSFDEDGNVDDSASSSGTYGNSGSSSGRNNSYSGYSYSRSNGYSGSRPYSGSGSSSFAGRVPATVDRETAIEIIEAGQRKLALLSHPDKGGSNDVMARINATTDWLVEQVKSAIPARTRS